MGFKDINQSNEANDVTNDINNNGTGDFLCNCFVISIGLILFNYLV